MVFPERPEEARHMFPPDKVRHRHLFYLSSNSRQTSNTIPSENVSFLSEVLGEYGSAFFSNKHRSCSYPAREVDGFVFLHEVFVFLSCLDRVVRNHQHSITGFFFLSLHFHLKMHYQH